MRTLDPNPDVNELLRYNGAKRPKPIPIPYNPRPPRDLTPPEPAWTIGEIATIVGSVVGLALAAWAIL